MSLEFFLKVTVLIFLGLIAALMGLVVSGSIKPLPVEIGGPFVGQIYAVANTIGNLSGIVGPVVTGRLLDRGPVNKIGTWYSVFALNAGCIVVGCFVFLFSAFKPIKWAEQADKYNLVEQ